VSFPGKSVTVQITNAVIGNLTYQKLFRFITDKYHPNLVRSSQFCRVIISIVSTIPAINQSINRSINHGCMLNCLIFLLSFIFLNR